MKKRIALFITLLVLSWGLTSLTATETPYKKHGEGAVSDAMGKTTPTGTFEHTMIEKNIRAFVERFLRLRPLKNVQFCSITRKGKILTTGIH